MQDTACPLTVRQLLAYELREEHDNSDDIAAILGITQAGVQELLRNGRIAVGAATIEDAQRILVDHGWLADRGRLPKAAFAYLRAFDAYLKTPRDRRDHMLVRELCDAALNELLAPRKGP
jgi:hypothetical protein